jgi:sterol desaturase/sphingolipid hydroxylase (fatty acid hydroxylase superfamily)
VEHVRRLKPRRVALAVLALAAAIVALLAAAAGAPGSAAGALVAGGSGVAMAALVFSVWEWSFHRYLYHRDRGGLLRPLFLTHHRDHHFVYFPPWRLTSDTWDDGSAGAHPSVWTPVASTLLGRQVTVSDRLVYVVLGVGLIGGGGALATGHWAFLWGTCAAGVVITLTFTRVHAAIHHPGSHPLLERLPWFPFLARHHDLHHLDTEANANFLLPLADWLFGTLRVPEPGADLFAAGRAMAPPSALTAGGG